ncbi:MAG: carboxypeptidase regulatory-like domain-containing protein [Candidatus Rokubacteria bacterium]|nr:carboxypeptidase regulatory-like domain-containing protein [Candidatus Rokubacteria bacterium]
MATATTTTQSGSGQEVHEPVHSCAKTKGSAMCEVLTARDGSDKTTAVADVKVELSNGPTSSPAKTTTGQGRAEFTALDAGQYTVTIKVEGPIAKFYDLDPAPAPQTRAVTTGPTAYSFLLKSVWIGAAVTYENGAPAPGVPWILRVKKRTGDRLAAKWSTHKEDTSTKEDYVEDYVSKGRYQLAAKVVTAPAWSETDLVVGTAVTLTAKCAWAEDETSGKFELFDVLDPATALHTLTAKAAAGKLEASWTPATDQLGSLKSGLLVFKASVGDVAAFSPVAKIGVKEKVELVDAAGTKLTKRVVLRLSNGQDVEANVNNGEVQITLPWGHAVARVSPTSVSGRVKVEANGGTRSVMVPA